MADYFTNGIGIIGAMLILVGFVLNELHKLDQDSLAYDLINLVGSCLLTIYAWLLGSIPFFVLNMIWALLSLRDVYLDLKINKHNKFLNE